MKMKKKMKGQARAEPTKKQGTKAKAVIPGTDIISKLINKVKGSFQIKDIKKFVLLNLPFVIIFLIADRTSLLYRISPGADIGNKLMYLMEHMDKIIGFIPSLAPIDLMVGAGTAAVVKLLIWQKRQDSKKFRKGVEYGSARWGTAEDIEPYVSDDRWMNIPLTATESLTMESRPKNPKYARNKNIMVIGGSGSGKTRFFVKPSIMQMNCSYVVTDPKGLI